MPDIDVDFANDRRDEIIQYAYDRYGRDRCAMVAEYICYRDRRGPRDVGRALGLPPTRLAAFARDLAAAMGAVGAGDEPEGVADPDGVEDDPPRRCPRRRRSGSWPPARRRRTRPCRPRPPR